MKLKLKLGMRETPKVVNWWKNSPRDFPHRVIYRGAKYEFVMYDEDDSKQTDYICVFSEIEPWNPSYNSGTYEDIGHLIDDAWGSKCECGAIHTSFPQFHMFFCPKWSKS